MIRELIDERRVENDDAPANFIVAVERRDPDPGYMSIVSAYLLRSFTIEAARATACSLGAEIGLGKVTLSLVVAEDGVGELSTFSTCLIETIPVG